MAAAMEDLAHQVDQRSTRHARARCRPLTRRRLITIAV